MLGAIRGIKTPEPSTSTCVAPHKTQKHPPFRIDNKYKKDAADIYDVIVSLNIPHFFAWVVSEYAATQYVKCSECHSKSGLVDCCKDYEYHERNIVVRNENDDILFTLCWNMSANIMFDENYEDIECDEILCFKCGEKWRCGVCEWQTFDYNHEEALVPGGCYYCKQNICDYCTLYVDSLQVGICDICYYDDDICEVDVNEDGIITDILN